MTRMYTVSEMAGLFGVSRQTLLYYDHIGLFRPSFVNDEGYRFYDPSQIPRLRLICILRDMGLKLKEIGAVISNPDPTPIVELLSGQVRAIDAEIDDLRQRRAGVLERLDFYKQMQYWRERINTPVLRHYPSRFIACQPFPSERAVTREVLHPTLMKCMARLRCEANSTPSRGWGTVLRQESFGLEDKLAGAGAFVVVPEGVDPHDLTGIQEVPEGIYLCLARWGMPYDVGGICELLSHMEEHGLHPTGDAFDFCLMDATNYTESHQEDFCCLQIPVEV